MLRRAATGAWAPVAACLGVLSLIALAACGSGSGSSSSSASARPPAQAAKVSLNVTITPSAGATPEHWTLQCEPTGGTHPDPAAACRQLLKTKNPFAPIPHGMMCPMISAGKAQATVSGTYFGKPVSARFSQSGRCAAARWAKLGEVFGSPVH